MPAALRSLGLLDILHEQACRALGRVPCTHASLRRFAAKPGEKCGSSFAVTPNAASCVIILFMLHVGLTGNIASGKSQAAQVFAELGAHVIDADAIAHDLLATVSISRKVIEFFGEGILNDGGSIDRKKLGEIVFNDDSKRAELNRTLHPQVAAEVLRRTAELEQRLPGAIIIVEAALLVESGRHDLYNKLIVVTCDPNLQLSRLIARDGLTSQQARARMDAQMPVEEKLKHADYTLETSGTLRETREQIEGIYRDLLVQEMRVRAGSED